jgi:hypothetical protein
LRSPSQFIRSSCFMLTDRQSVGRNDFNRRTAILLTPLEIVPLACLKFIAVGGLVVACFQLGIKFAGSNPAEDGGFLRTKIIRSTTYWPLSCVMFAYFTTWRMLESINSLIITFECFISCRSDGIV